MRAAGPVLVLCMARLSVEVSSGARGGGGALLGMRVRCLAHRSQVQHAAHMASLPEREA